LTVIQRDQDHYEHKGWRIILQIVPDGWLYCLWPPNARDGDQYIWATETLRAAREYIDGQRAADHESNTQPGGEP
jgi:hypothetical protein